MMQLPVQEGIYASNSFAHYLFIHLKMDLNIQKEYRHF